MLNFLNKNHSENIVAEICLNAECIEFFDNHGRVKIDLKQENQIQKRTLHYGKYSSKNNKSFSSNYLFWNQDTTSTFPVNRKVLFEPCGYEKVKVTFSKVESFCPVVCGIFLDTAVLDAMLDVVLISDVDPIDAPGPRIIYVNKTFETMTGYKYEEIIGRSPSFLQGPLTCAVAKSQIKEHLLQWKPFNSVLKNYSRDGRVFDVELSVSPVADETGWFVYWVAVQRDITQRCLNEAKARAISESFPGAIYEFKLNKSGSMGFSYLSSNGMQLFKIDAKKFQEDPAIILKLVHPDDSDHLLSLINQSAKAMQTFKWSGRIFTTTGELLWISASSIPYYDQNGEITWNGVIIDITEDTLLKKKLADQLAADNHQRRLAQIGELAASVAHEIKNPLMILNGYVDKIKAKINKDPRMATEFENSFSKIGAAAKRIEQIVNGLRSVTRSDDSVESKIDVNQTVLQSIEMLAEIYQKQGVLVRFHGINEKILVKGDPAKLQQCVLNLVGNAKDALSESFEKKIDVSVRVEKKEIFIDVKDSGCGIPLEIQEKIFTPFFTTKPVGEGTGIGLSTTLGIVSAMHGKVTFLTGKTGTLFSIILPVDESDVGNNKGEQGNRITEDKNKMHYDLKVLVVEDESDLRSLLVEYLHGMHLTVFDANNGYSALDIMKKQKIDVVFTDAQMPLMDGPTFILELKKYCLEKSSLLPLIYLISGHSLEDTTATFSGLSDVRNLIQGTLEKPIKWNRIEKILGAICESKTSAKDQLSSQISNF